MTLQGNNPAQIEIGASYSDLGATVTDNIDQNLGYEVWRDGVLLGRNLTGVSVDTTVPAEHLINYVATDNVGNTATSTRTVIVFDLYIDMTATSTETAASTVATD